MTIEEYRESLKNYILENCKDYDKDFVINRLDKINSWIDSYYDNLNSEYNGDINKVINDAKSDLTLLFSKFTKEEFRKIIVDKLFSLEINTKSKEEINKCIDREINILNRNFEDAVNKNDFYHGIEGAYTEYFYSFMY
jgi:hypothetical protein